MGWALAIVFAVLFVTAASAKDVALILNEQQQQQLRGVLDLATKAYGLQVAPTTVELMNALAKAPVVTEHKDEEKPKDEPQ